MVHPVSSLATNNVTVSGLVSGLDSEQIVDGLLAVEKAKIERLESQQDEVALKQQAFKTVEARLLALQTSISGLVKTKNSVFSSRAATSSDESLVTAAASSSAIPGSYIIRANSLAKSHQIASQGFDSPSSEITQGTLQITAGGASATITVDSTNNTLSGLADAINQSGLEVTASVINDGRNQPYRLMLIAEKTGTANSISITNNLAADSGSARKPVFTTTTIGAAFLDPGYTGTSTPTSNSGAGTYTGNTNNTYTFTVVTGGTVGTDNGIQVSYTDATGANSGTLTIDSGDADVFKSVAEGIQVKFSAGTLIAGEKFTIDTSVPTVQEAADASVTLGSGNGAITVTSESNQIDDLIPGVTLDLLGADPNKEITIGVTADVDTAKQAILDFVDAYNDLIETIDEQIRYDPETDTAGPLLGDRNVIAIQDQIRLAAIAAVDGLPSTANRLGAIGITTTELGTLAVDEAKLDEVLNDGPFALDEIHKIFALTGEVTHPGIVFISAGLDAKANGGGSPYQVEITQAAEQASVTATNTLAASTTIDGTNDSLTVRIDGAEATVTLTQGTFTRVQLAQMVADQINASEDLPGRQVTASVQNDRLVVTSVSYGSISEVAFTGGTALTDLGLTGTESDKGQDVAGNYLVDGVIEPATGSGQLLIGESDNPNTSSVQVRVTLTSSQLQAGPEADLTIYRGVASQIDVLLNSYLDPVTGRIESTNDQFQDQIDDLQETIDRQNELLESKRQSLLQQFAAMESAISELRSISDFLSAQLVNVIGGSN